MQYYIGCSGWSYSAWQGPFYPFNLDSSSDWLKFYASVFNYVEIRCISSAGVPYGELVKYRILNVLGMDSTGIAMNSTKIINPLPDILKSRLAKGHIGGREVSLAFLPEVIEPSGALYSSANDLLKYLAANMDLIHTKINDILQDTHLIRHEEATIANSSSATTQNLLAIYIGLGWDIVTNLGTEVIYHTGGIDGYHSLVAFNPTKQIGSVVLCSCDEKDDLPADWVNTVILSLLRPSGIFTPAKAAPVTNASLSNS